MEMWIGVYRIFFSPEGGDGIWSEPGWCRSNNLWAMRSWRKHPLHTCILKFEASTKTLHISNDVIAHAIKNCPFDLYHLVGTINVGCKKINCRHSYVSKVSPLFNVCSDACKNSNHLVGGCHLAFWVLCCRHPCTNESQWWCKTCLHQPHECHNCAFFIATEVSIRQCILSTHEEMLFVKADATCEKVYFCIKLKESNQHNLLNYISST